MNLILRLLWVLLAARSRGALSLNDVSRVPMRVLPNDLDLNMHMNNGRYLSIMDLGRIDFLIRMGLSRKFVENRWQPLAGGTLIRYRFALRIFAKFEIVTRLLCWDEKWFYFEQRLEADGNVAAIALTKAMARGRADAVSPAIILQAIGLDTPSPPAPEAVSRWQAAEDLLHFGKHG